MRNTKWILSGAGLVIAVLAIITVIASTAPSGFPSGATVRIPRGFTVTEAAEMLADSGVIRSQLLFKIYTTLIDHSTGIKTGEYLFEKGESVMRVASRLVRG